MGDGACKQALQDNVKKDGLDNVLFIPSVSKEDVMRYWSLLNVSIIHLKNSSVFKSVIPSKLFESMGMGIPVIHGVCGESAEIVEHYEVGLFFKPENAEELSNNILRLKNEKKLIEFYKNNTLQAAKKYDRLIKAREMLNILIHLAKNDYGKY